MHFAEIQLETHVLDELHAFYCGTLGFREIARRKTMFTVEAGSSTLTFHRCREKEAQPFYHFALNIPENQLAEAKAWLQGKTQLLRDTTEDEFHFPDWNAHAIYFCDPAGNIVEFIARHNLPNRSSEPFSASSMTCVSEVGVPVEDVSLFCREVQQSVGARLWSGDGKHFAALGDENGLFIVVPHGHKWAPSGVPAAAFQPTVQLE